MKKLTILLIPILLITVNTFAQLDCSKFKTGKFQIIENGEGKDKIERNDSIQIEQYGKVIIKLKIEWIDECSYRLSFLEGNKAWKKSIDKDRPTPDLIVRIIEVKENSYVQESKFVGNNEFKYKSEIKKIE